MNGQRLWATVVDQLRSYVDANVRTLLAQLQPMTSTLTADPALPDGRLLSVVEPPAGTPLSDLVRQMAGELTVNSQIRVQFWRREPTADLGLAVVLRHPVTPTRMAIAAVTPAGVDDPIFDVVITAGEPLAFTAGNDPWTATTTVATPEGWEATSGGGHVSGPPRGALTIRAERKRKHTVGMVGGPGLSIDGFAIGLSATQNGATTVQLDLHGLKVSVLPEGVAKLVGATPGEASESTARQPEPITLVADHVSGMRFAGGGLSVGLPVRFTAGGLQGRGTTLTLATDDGVKVEVTTALTATLPGLPLTAMISGAGFGLPVVFEGADPPKLGLGTVPIDPASIGVDLRLPPVSGGGTLVKMADGYAGAISADLGIIAVQAVAQFRPPSQTRPVTSFLVMFGVVFPPPGIQLSFGFALDAIGGLVGVNHRVDVTELRQLVSDGHADRVLFPDDLVQRADEVVGALSKCFPPARGRFVIAPMVRITWGGRMVSLSGALILELPAPVRATILGRLLVALPDPVVPLVRLQASVLGRFDPAIPEMELLVSLTGSYIVGLVVEGEIYLLVRGGDSPEFVLSAGGFHPRYQRPAGVPALRRLAIDLAPGAGYGMHIEAYLALTSTSVQFGGRLQLEAMVAGCGIEGWLGLDALFRFEPTFCFSVQIRAGVAVRAFGYRLASVALAFTLEGPAPWHAFGYGSVSVLFWDASLDFDISWGSRPALNQAIDDERILADLSTAVAQPKAWLAERPQTERTGLTFTAEAVGLMADGQLVHPDASIRFTQNVIPLDVVFSRYSRHPVAEQNWSIAAIKLGAGPPQKVEQLNVLETFVRGEFFALSEEEQLTAPSAVTHASGATISDDGFDIGPGHRVDDGFETAYKPKQEDEKWRQWPSLLEVESAHAWLAVDRLNRWRVGARDAAVRVVSPGLRAATGGGIVMRTLDAVVGTTEMPADDRVATPFTTDPWQVIQDQQHAAPGAPRLLESWETA